MRSDFIQPDAKAMMRWRVSEDGKISVTAVDFGCNVCKPDPVRVKVEIAPEVVPALIEWLQSSTRNQGTP